MKALEYRVVDAKVKLEADNIQKIEEQIEGVKKIINPQQYQCIAMDGHIILEGAFHPDAIIIYKTPRPPVDYGINKYPKHLQEEMQKIQNELNLTKGQVEKLRKSIAEIDLKVMELESQQKFLRDNASKIKENDEKEKMINNFNKRYSSFHECLISNLETLDSQVKNDVRKSLDILVQIIGEVKQKYL